MPTALIVTADLGGNLPPALGIGRALAAWGWPVLVPGHADVAAAAAAAGLAAAPAPRSRRYDPVRPRGTLRTLREVTAAWTDADLAADAVSAALEARADVAVVDALLLGPLAALGRAGVPTAALAHSSWEGVRTFVTGAPGAALKLRGVDPLAVLGGADRLLVASHPALGRDLPLPPGAVVTGPVLQEEPRRAPRDGRPLVVVSLSSVAFPGQARVLQRALDAVAGLDADVVASTGRAVPPGSVRARAGTELVTTADHAALLPRASALVFHGGHATAVRALAHGVPTAVLPLHPFMDQPRIGAALQRAGAGLLLPRSARPPRIRAAMLQLLGSPALRHGAEQLGHDVVAARGAQRAADEVAALVGARPQ